MLAVSALAAWPAQAAKIRIVTPLTDLADLTTDLDPHLPLVSCLAGEFNQVVLNLIVNAAHAIGDVVARDGTKKGLITITTRSCRA